MAELLGTLSRKPKCYSLYHVTFLLLISVVLVYFGYCHLNRRHRNMENMLAWESLGLRKPGGLKVVKLSQMIYPQPDLRSPTRKDVLVVTPWQAPIVWEGTFNTDILNDQFRHQNATIGLTVFAVKKYVIFLSSFLKSAESFFMVGHRVNYYVFTDLPHTVPRVHLQNGRQLFVLKVRNYTRWQDISMHRMEIISNFSKQRFQREVDYLVCSDVDMKFRDHVGVEILSSLFGTLHPGFFGHSRQSFTYERRALSQAYISQDEGDFYYIGALFGGTVQEVYRLTKACHEAIMTDKGNNIEAVWQEESHLNKYLLYYKPTKVLSPEYMWDNRMLLQMTPIQLLQWNMVIRKKRFVILIKNYETLRS
ncbi:PREDICTED: histo-blood group ABO system transferase-like [Chrysochloris asiatica]|uniref:Histo-blood group ABO system transferase-like n=1 Tax=Chrysochloris asiatica TaxID=185453 RepID=A0A9B0U196_CHRAS|nr:PREDICTED: histo-blood group ABO system transferase-like [Chrysochloris asiatica]